MKQKFMISKTAVETLVSGTQLTFARIVPAVYKEYSSFLDEIKDKVCYPVFY